MSDFTQETPLQDLDSAVSFELRGDLDRRTFGGNLAKTDGTLFDLAVALEDGNGMITTDDENLITALDAHEALVREGTPVSPAKATAKEIVDGAGELTAEQAEAELAAEQSRPEGPRKTVVEALTNRLEQLAANDNTENPEA